MSASQGIRRVAYWFDVAEARQKMLSANMTAANANNYADARNRAIVELELYIDARIDEKLNAAIRVQDNHPTEQTSSPKTVKGE